MSKQTAVEWLEEKLKENLKHIVLNGDYVLMESIFLQAKAMEREQIIDAWDNGCENVKQLMENQNICLNDKMGISNQVPFYEICSCNPKNGGSGICGCTISNKMVYGK